MLKVRHISISPYYNRSHQCFVFFKYVTVQLQNWKLINSRQAKGPPKEQGSIGDSGDRNTKS